MSIEAPSLTLTLNVRFPDPDRDLGGKFRKALGPLFGNWIFSHFEKAIAARR